MMKCTKHPTYRAIRKPRCSCHVCWAIFNLKHNKPKTEYRRIAAIGLTVHEEPSAHVKREELHKVLRKMGKVREFGKLYGVQTQSEFGLYPWDVEAVLERMASGKLTGTQRFWD